MTNHDNLLSATNIKYLLVLFNLCKDNKETRCVYIADIMKLSKPSVHKMINTLKDKEIVSQNLYSKVAFTEHGYRLAEMYSKYYEILANKISRVIDDTDIAKDVICAAMAEMELEYIKSVCNKITNKEG